MFEIFLYLSGAALALVALPVALRMRIDRPLPGSAVAIRAEASLLAGLVGVAFTGPDAWRWGPTLARRSLGGLAFPLRYRGGAGGREEPVPEQQRQGAAETAGEGPDRTARRRRRTQPRRLRRVAIRPGLRMLRALPRCINLRRLRVDGRVGLGDPAKTGYLYGVVQSLEAALPQRRKQLQIQLEPDFREQVFCGRLEICLHLSLMRLAASGLRFGLEMGGRRLSDCLRSARWVPFRPDWRAS